MLKHDIRVEILSNPQLLKSIRGLVREYIESFGISRDRADEVVLAVDEACANAIRHSYGFDEDGRIQLSLCANGGWIEIELRDEGVPAQAPRLERKDLTVPDKESLTPGGLGVQLIYRVFDEVRFSPGETCGNTVLMRLRLPA